MKHLYYLLVAVFLIGCNLNDDSEIISPDSESPIFYASIESVDSRTYLDEDEKMRWTKDDRITIFVGENYNREFAFTGSSGSTAGGFTQKSVDGFYTAEKVSANYAVYPYNSTTLLETEGYFQLSMPSIQNYAEDSFGLNANTMVAVTESTSDMFLQFKNVCSYLRLALYGDDITVKHITLQGNNEEPLAGLAKVTPAFEGEPTLTWIAEGSSPVLKLDCGEGVKLGTSESLATYFWLVVPPATLENGFTIRVVDTNNKMYEKSTSSTQIFTRNISKKMPALKVVCDQNAPADEGDDENGDDSTINYDVPKNQIWYKTKYDFAITLPTEATTNANLMAHTYENGIGKLIFDNDVTSLETGAFAGLHSITNFWLPNGLKTIRYDNSSLDGVFEGCTGLVSITIPEGVKLIGNRAFSGCTGLTSINLPEGLTDIGSSAFSGCKSLTSINLPEGLTSIGYDAFSGCTSLTSINLPESLTSIGSSAFDGCTGLTSIDLPAGLTSIGSSAFEGCTGLTSIDFPESLTSIGSYAFSGCKGLTSINLPEGLTSIGNSAFEDCTGKLTVCCNLPNGTYDSYPLAVSLFTEVKIMEGVTSIGAYAFYNLTSLINVDLPNSLTSIGGAAFSGCTGLTNIDLPENLTSIGGSAFSGCTGLTNIDLPENLTSIGRFAFSGCTSLTSIDLPESLISIGDYAFSGFTGLTSIDLPESLTSIGGSAFSGCTSLTSIDLPESLTSIGELAFSGCTGLTNIDFPESLTSIGYSAFMDCTGLTSINLPESLISIGGTAFSGCSGLENISIPKSVTSFGHAVFENCSGILTMHCNVPNRSSQGYYPMKGAKFSEVRISEGVTRIGDYAFYDCSTLTSIALPSSLKSIGRSAFSGCLGLTDITIPQNVTSFGSGVFAGCSGTLTLHCNLPNFTNGSYSPMNGAAFSEVKISEGVTRIGDYAFYFCTTLTSIDLPSSLISIGDGAFCDCEGMKSVYCRALMPPTCYSGTFSYVNATVYVPQEALSAYQSASYWKNMNLVGYDFEE